MSEKSKDEPQPRRKTRAPYRPPRIVDEEAFEREALLTCGGTKASLGTCGPFYKNLS